MPDDPFKTSNVRGTVAFAFAAANGRTTQVFFNQCDNSSTHDAGRPADGHTLRPQRQSEPPLDKFCASYLGAFTCQYVPPALSIVEPA